MMKKFFGIVFSIMLALTFLFVACSKKEKDDMNWNKDGSLKILAIGNSFSEDAVEYAWDIANSLGIQNVMIGHLYIGGCSLDMHYNNLTNSLPNYEYRLNYNGTWERTANYNALDAITSEDWDYITIQQVSGQSGLSERYTALDGVVDLIKNNAQNAKIVWHQTWAYQEDSNHGDFVLYDSNQLIMYNAICDTVKDTVLKNKNIKDVIPSGTAIQNARTSSMGDTLTRDGYHLSVIGRYIAGLTYIHKLTGLDISNIEYFPDLTKEIKEICIESAKNAVENPFRITQSEK